MDTFDSADTNSRVQQVPSEELDATAGGVIAVVVAFVGDVDDADGVTPTGQLLGDMVPLRKCQLISGRDSGGLTYDEAVASGNKNFLS